MTVVLEGYIRVPPNEIKTLRYKLQAHIEQTLDEGVVWHSRLRRMTMTRVFFMFSKSLWMKRPSMRIKQELRSVSGAP